MHRVRIKIAHRPPEVSSSSFVAIPKYSIFPIKKARPVRYSHQSVSETRLWVIVSDMSSSNSASLYQVVHRADILGDGIYGYTFRTDRNSEVTVDCNASVSITISYLPWQRSADLPDGRKLVIRTSPVGK